MSPCEDNDAVDQLTTGMVGKHRFVLALADSAATKVARRVARAMQGLSDSRLSGDDSELANVWDEICVQVQYDQFESWEVYEKAGKAALAGFVSEFTEHERAAVWLQTDTGWDWDYDNCDANARCPVVEEDVVDYVWKEYVLVLAGRWTNARIRAYLDRAGAAD